MPDPRTTPLAADVTDFAFVGLEEWEARVIGELGEDGALALLARATPEGIAKHPLSVEQDSDAADLPARSPGWRRLAWLDGYEPGARELVARDLAGGADGVALPVSAVPILGTLELHRRTVLVAAHAEPGALAAVGATSAATTVAGYDPLGAMTRDGGVPGGLDEALGRLAELARASDATHPLGIDVGAAHRAGAHAVQELAYVLGTLAEVLRRAEPGGLAPHDVAARTSLSFEIGRDVFGEVAKLRAARIVWTKLFVACGVARPKGPWIHATTSWRTLARKDPSTNMLRATTQAFAAAVGGADSIAVRAYDSALGLPSTLGRRIARNTQTILACEAHLDRVADPVAGSYAVERRADELARAAWAHFRRIEGRGGMARVLLDGTLRAEVDASWDAWRARLAERTEHVLGVSLHAIEGETLLERPPAPSAPRPGTTIEPFPARRDAAEAGG